MKFKPHIRTSDRNIVRWLLLAEYRWQTSVAVSSMLYKGHEVMLASCLPCWEEVELAMCSVFLLTEPGQLQCQKKFLKQISEMLHYYLPVHTSIFMFCFFFYLLQLLTQKYRRFLQWKVIVAKRGIVTFSVFWSLSLEITLIDPNHEAL